MTRTGVNILLIGLLFVGVGGALYLLVGFFENIQLFDTAVLTCWGLGAALVVVGAITAGLGRLGSHER